MKVIWSRTSFLGGLRTAGLAATVVAAGFLGLSGAASSQSVTPEDVDHVQHFLDCFGVMITDPAAHAAFCQPGRAKPDEDPVTTSRDCVPVPAYDDADVVNDERCYILSDDSN